MFHFLIRLDEQMVFGVVLGFKNAKKYFKIYFIKHYLTIDML